MIDMQPINNAIKVIAASQSLTDVVPMSACLIASSDAGKSATLLSHLPHGARVLDDLTSASLYQVLNVEDPKEPRPRVLVLPDLNQAISHKPTVVQLLMAALLALMGEGLTEIPGIDKANKFKLKAEEMAAGGMRVAVLTGMTPEMFFSQRAKWRNIGLLRRLTPIFYCYPQATIDKIQQKIQNQPAGKKVEIYPRIFLPEVEPGAPVMPSHIARKVRELSQHLIDHQLVWRKPMGDGRVQIIKALDLPFSVHKTLKTFVRASALLHGRGTVNADDMDALKQFARFVRYDQPEEV